MQRDVFVRPLISGQCLAAVVHIELRREIISFSSDFFKD
jgi:hypothetical protein